MGRWLRVTARIAPLKLHRIEVAQRRVAATMIVKADVAEQVGFRLVVAGMARQVHPLIQRTEDALHRGVDPAVDRA